MNKLYGAALAIAAIGCILADYASAADTIGESIIASPNEIHVTDGDTIKIGTLRVRINGIDAPELQQDGGTESRDRLENLIATGEMITCRTRDHDHYGRTVATCYNIHGTDLADVMVRDGLAFAYREYSFDYLTAQEFAEANKRGLWAHNPVMPWTFRRSKRN